MSRAPFLLFPQRRLPRASGTSSARGKAKTWARQFIARKLLTNLRYCRVYFAGARGRSARRHCRITPGFAEARTLFSGCRFALVVVGVREGVRFGLFVRFDDGYS